MSFFWCLDHKTVEEGFGCGSSSRLGPYDSREQAASAMDRVRKRGKEQDAKDKANEQKGGKK
jgi:hypothetical protein